MLCTSRIWQTSGSMIDLHTHTTFSDGTSTPEALLQEARSIGLRALAITDHDTFSGFDAVLPLAPQHGIELICGLELSTQVYVEQIGRSSQVHLLGYFLGQLPPPHFREWLTTISSLRYARNLKLMAHLQAKISPSTGPIFRYRHRPSAVRISRMCCSLKATFRTGKGPSICISPTKCWVASSESCHPSPKALREFAAPVACLHLLIRCGFLFITWRCGHSFRK